MSQLKPTQLEQIQSNRRLYLNASIACSLLASISTWIALSPNSASDEFDREAPLIHHRLDGLSDRISQLDKKLTQLKNDVSGINKENFADYPEPIQVRFAELETEGVEIRSESEALKAKIESLDRKSSPSPAQKPLIIIVATLAGLQLIFLVAHRNSRRVFSLKEDATIATDDEKNQTRYQSIDEDVIES